MQLASGQAEAKGHGQGSRGSESSVREASDHHPLRPRLGEEARGIVFIVGVNLTLIIIIIDRRLHRIDLLVRLQRYAARDQGRHQEGPLHDHRQVHSRG